MKNSLYILAFLIVAAGFVIGAQAQEDDSFADITYPVAELGNCADKSDCLDYCDNPDNMEPCLDFAEENNLMPEEDIAIARKMLAAGQTAGPGGCRGQAECETYCDDINHIEECLAFAEEHNLIPPEELVEGRKVAAAIKRGITPPNCSNKKDCDVYCSQPGNMEECLIFAEAAGLIPEDELEEAKMVLSAIQKGIKPPPCGGKDACEEYCALPENFETCITFAEAAGFVSPEEAAMARRTGGKGPGNCRGKEACEVYCEDPANMEVCIDFAIEYGFMSPEEAEQAKKMLAAGFTTGPGGCKGEDECETYCEDFSHMEECVNFAEKAGFMTPEDAARARQMMEKGINMMQGGPGGCKGEEECRAFCEDPANMEECMNFAVQIGEMTPEEAEQARKGMEMMRQGGPGGCTSEEECMAFCEDPSHGEECIRFSMEMGTMSPEEGQRMMEMMQGGPQEMMERAPEGMMPEGREIPEGMEQEIQRQTEQQIQQQIEQQIQQEIQQQIQQQMEQMMPSPEQPQSLFEAVKNFLAGLIKNP